MDAWVWVQTRLRGVFFEFINQFTIRKFQLIAVEYTGLQFTKDVFSPKKGMDSKTFTSKKCILCQVKSYHCNNLTSKRCVHNRDLINIQSKRWNKSINVNGKFLTNWDKANQSNSYPILTMKLFWLTVHAIISNYVYMHNIHIGYYSVGWLKGVGWLQFGKKTLVRTPDHLIATPLLGGVLS